MRLFSFLNFQCLLQRSWPRTLRPKGPRVTPSPSPTPGGRKSKRPLPNSTVVLVGNVAKLSSPKPCFGWLSFWSFWTPASLLLNITDSPPGWMTSRTSPTSSSLCSLPAKCSSRCTVLAFKWVITFNFHMWFSAVQFLPCFQNIMQNLKNWLFFTTMQPLVKLSFRLPFMILCCLVDYYSWLSNKRRLPKYRNEEQNHHCSLGQFLKTLRWFWCDKILPWHHVY